MWSVADRGARRIAAMVVAAAIGMSGLPPGNAWSAQPLPTLPSGTGKSAEQQAPKPPDEPAKVPEFVGRLDDRQARAVLLDLLQQRKPAETAQDHDSLGDLANRAGTLFRTAGARLVGLAAALGEIREAWSSLLRFLDLDTSPWLPMAWRALAILLAGFSAEVLVVLALARLRKGGPGARSPSRRLRPRWIAVRALGLGAFTASTAIAAEILNASLPQGQQVLLATSGAALLLVRLADFLALGCIRLLIPLPLGAGLRPKSSLLRLQIALVHGMAAFGAALLGALHRAGTSADFRLVVALAIWTGLIATLAAALNRLDMMSTPPVPSADPADGPVFDWLRIHWLGAALTGCIVLWLVTVEQALESGLVAIRAGVLTLLVCAYVPAMVRLVTVSVRQVRRRAGTDGHAIRPAWSMAVVRCTRVIGALAAVWAVARIWDVDLAGMATDRFGESAVRAGTGVLTVLLLAYGAWEVVKALVRGGSENGNPYEAPADDLSHMRPASRMQTFLPLVEKFLFAIVVVVAALGVMRALGVDTGPLLAGAGIAGIAIGFGAQTLVRDIVSGIFFLFDDAFRLGEYVEIDQTRGTVEGISIRSLRIRHHRGAVHTVPFGTIHRLTNYSRDWIILKLEFLLAFDTDLSKVKKIVKQIGKELMEDPEFGPHFLEPVKSQGVRRMEQIGMVVGVKFMAKPGEQFILRREVYQRVRDAFEKNGISFARPQVVVQVPSGSRIQPEDEEAIAAAAADAALPHEPPPQKTGRGSNSP